MSQLTLNDIVDLRAYESTRESFLKEVIAIKKIRRVSIGPVVSLTFENATTIRFQIQEMARAEKILSNDRIQEELDIYNPLIHSPGGLSSTLFIELTSDEEMVHWLPLLVGIERSLEFRFGEGNSQYVRCAPEQTHEEQLTREEITPAVHYVKFEFTRDQIELFGMNSVELVVDHPHYQESTRLSEETRQALLDSLLLGG